MNRPDRISGLRWTVLVAAVLGVGVPSWGQTSADDITRRLDQVQRETRLRVSPDLPAGDRALIDYGGFLTLSYFSTDTSEGDNRALRQYDLNLFARVNFDGAHEFYSRGRFQYRDYNPGDQSVTDDDGLQGFLEEAYYKFDLARHLAAYGGVATSNNVTITAGRQFVDWASGLVLAQYVDGGLAQANLGPVGFTLLAGVTTYGTTDFDSSRPNFDKSTYRGFYGGLVSYQVGQHRPYAYGLIQRDNNRDRRVNIAGAEVQYDYNSYYIGAGSNGNLSDNFVYAVEGVYQGGSTLSGQTFTEGGLPVPQSDDSISAWAGQASLDYLLGDERKTRFGLGVIVASGDSDRGRSSETLDGNEPGTTDKGFNGLGLVSAGFAFAPPVSNLIVIRGTASTFPWGGRSGSISRMQFGGDVLAYGKTTTAAPIDELTTDDRYLGTEAGVYMNWRVVEDVTLQVRYAAFFPGDAIEDNDVRQFFYTSFTYSF